MTFRRTTRIATAAVAFGLLAAACGGGGDSGGSDAVPAPAATTSGDEAVGAPDDGAVVPASLQFTAPLIGGGEIDANGLAGKPTAFWFWSPT